MSSVLAMLPRLPSVLTQSSSSPDGSGKQGGGYFQSSPEEDEEEPLHKPERGEVAKRRRALKCGMNASWRRKNMKAAVEPESDDEEATPSDEEEEADAQDPASHSGLEEDAAAENDIIASYYELDDVRIPPRRFHRNLKRFYAFFLCLGITINPLKRKSKKKLLSGRPEQAEDDKAMAEAGACPVPVDSHTSWWVRCLKLRWLSLSISLMALFVHASVNVVCALHSTARVARCIFALFGVLSWVAAVLLAQDILSRRMIGTRLFYVLNNTIQKRRVTRLIKDLFTAQLITMIVVSAFGILSDVLQWPEARQSFTWMLRHHLVGLHATTREAAAVPGARAVYHLATVWEVPIWVLWIVSSVIVRVQLAAGVAVFSTIIGVHLLRLDSCLRALKRPGTSVHRASVQVFDIDVSLAELSFMLDVRLSCLLVCSFLTFFFQSVYLTNREKDDNPEDDTSPFDVLALSFPCMLCAWMLLGCSSINQACQRLTIVATRFAGFQERERLNAKYRSIAGGADGDSGWDTEGAKDDDNNGVRDGDEVEERKKKAGSKKDAASSKQSKGDAKSKSNSSSSSDDKSKKEDGKKGKKDSASSSDDKGKSKASKKDDSASSSSSSKDGAEVAASPDAASTSSSPDNVPADPNVRNVGGIARLSAMDTHGLPASDALERANQDLDGDGDCDLDDDLELLKDRLDAFMAYLKNADIRLRLADIEIDTKVVWGFVLVSSSTLFSLLQIQHTNLL